MARILSNETSLSRQQKKLGRETRVLRNLLWAESGLAVLLLAGGAVLWLMGKGTSLFVVGVIFGFLAYAHHLKTKQNARDEKYMAAGLRGENEVAEMLAQNLDNTYYLYNDLMIRTGFTRAQIDHLVVCPKGIFVIETKNWRGRITGDEEGRSWLQYRAPDLPPRPLSNPILQNRRHVMVLEKFLRSGGVPDLPLIPMLVFTGRNTTLDIKNQKTLLLWPRETVDYILRHEPGKTATEAEVDAVIHRLQRCV
ncbi:MAG TPA: nuclease-related domain-containing protein [Kiritimatiellia bacterium]|nr:nuclease-related domain-containing protein [Kiritimatiellia bacterium]